MYREKSYLGVGRGCPQAEKGEREKGKVGIFLFLSTFPFIYSNGLLTSVNVEFRIFGSGDFMLLSDTLD